MRCDAMRFDWSMAQERWRFAAKILSILSERLILDGHNFLIKTLPRVSTEMSLHVLAYNLKRMMSLFGTSELLEVIRA